MKWGHWSQQTQHLLTEASCRLLLPAPGHPYLVQYHCSRAMRNRIMRNQISNFGFSFLLLLMLFWLLFFPFIFKAFLSYESKLLLSIDLSYRLLAGLSRVSLRHMTECIAYVVFIEWLGLERILKIESLHSWATVIWSITFRTKNKWTVKIILILF